MAEWKKPYDLHNFLVICLRICIGPDIHPAPTGIGFGFWIGEETNG